MNRIMQTVLASALVLAIVFPVPGGATTLNYKSPVDAQDVTVPVHEEGNGYYLVDLYHITKGNGRYVPAGDGEVEDIFFATITKYEQDNPGWVVDTFGPFLIGQASGANVYSYWIHVKPSQTQ